MTALGHEISSGALRVGICLLGNTAAVVLLLFVIRFILLPLPVKRASLPAGTIVRQCPPRAPRQPEPGPLGAWQHGHARTRTLFGFL